MAKSGIVLTQKQATEMAYFQVGIDITAHYLFGLIRVFAEWKKYQGAPSGPYYLSECVCNLDWCALDIADTNANGRDLSHVRHT